MALKFEITGDNRNFLDSLNGVRTGVDRAAKDIEESGASIEDMFKRIAAAAGIAFSLGQAKSFVGSVMDMRGQFQQLEIAFSTMLQSEEKANALMAQLVDTAAKTPFDLQGVSEGAKQLLAYGTAAEEVNETITRLGDIAAGLSIPLGDLVYLYGTTMTQGRMFTMDLRQFQGRGIPMADELAKIFGVAKDRVSELVTAGEVGADKVKQAIWNMTDAGSKFGGLMEKQSTSITGQIANIEDAIDVMLNDIGQSQEGIINMGLDLAGKIVENWQKVGEAIAVAATAYGSYKAILMAVTAYQTIESRLLGQIALEKSLAAAAGIKLSDAEAMAAAKTKLLTIAQNGLSTALKRVAAATIANPYVIAAAAVTSLVYITYKCVTADTALEAAQKSLTRALDKTAEAQKKYNEETSAAIDLANDDAAATEDRDAALQTLIHRYPSIIQKYIDEKGQLRDILALKKEIAEFDGKKQRQETTDTLKRESEDASRRYALASELLQKRESRGRLSTDEREQANALRRQYAKDAGVSVLRAVSTDLANIRDFYKVKASTGKRRYARKLTENKLTGFTAEGGALGDMNDNALKALQTKLHNSQTEAKKKTSVFIQEIGDYLTYDDRKDLLTRVDAMVKERSKPKKTNAGWAADKKSKYELALKAYNDFVNNDKGLKTDDEYTKKLKELKDKLDAAKKEYDSTKSENNKGGKGGGTNGGNDDTEKRLEAQEELNKSLKELQQQNTDTSISLMKDGTEKKIAEIKNDYEKQKAEIDKQEREFKEKNKEAGKSPTLTKEQSDAISEARGLAKQKKDKQTSEIYKEELSAMRDYLKEYGSIEQQKAAITAEYTQKIADEDNAIRKALLEKEKDQAIESLNFQQLQGDLDWESVFNNLDRVSTETLQGLHKKLKAALSVGDIGAEDAQVISQKILEIEDKISDKTGVWSSLIPALKERERLTRAAVSAQEEYNRLLGEQAAAESKVQEAKEGIQSAIMELYGKDIKTADIRVDGKLQLFDELGVDATTEAGRKLVDCFDRLQIATTDLTLAEEKSSDAKKKVSNANALLSGSSIGDIFKNAQDSAGGGAMGIIHLVNQNAQSLAEFVDKVGLAGTDFGDAAHEFADGVAGFSNAIQSLASGDVIGAVNGVLDGIAGYVRAYTIIFGGSGNEEEMEERIAELAKSNEMLASSINSLAERIADGDTTNQESVEAYKQAYQAEQDWERNQREAINSRASEWTNTGYGFLGLGGKSSFNKHMAGNDWSGWDKFSQVLKEHGENVNVNRDNIWDLTPEQMKLLRDFAPEQWAALMNGEGHKNPITLVNEYIDRAGTLEELTSAMNEKLTGYSWDGFRDSFSSLLTDMDSDLEDFGDNIEEVLSKAILNSLLTTKYKARIDALYKMIADAAMDDEITKTEADAIRATNEQIAKDMLADRQALLDLGIINGESYQQEASTKGFQSMSQDTGEELNGRFTALQISGDTIAQQAVQIYGQMMAIAAIQTSSNNFLAEMRNLMITSNSYLDNVAKYSKKMYLEFGEKLDSVISNTKNL